ncbi:MAG: transposase [Phycisphaerae bacterium]
MVILGYHVIFTTYGTWLPNDPRGSYSKTIYQKELRAWGEIKYGRQNPQPSREIMKKFWKSTELHLPRPSFFLNDTTRNTVALAFGVVVKRLNLKIPTCAIMNDHIHLLVLPSKYKIEYIVNQLKGAAAHYIESNPPRAGLPLQKWDIVEKLL